MAEAHRNEGIDPLYRQLKARFPGIVIGWIGDPAHQSRESAHNPNSAGRVNAIDVMIQGVFTWADALWLAAVLAFHHDKRINNVIFNKRIWDDANGEWRYYPGSDPHTNHLHIEVHDSAHTNQSDWDLDTEDEEMPTAKEIVNELLNTKLDIDIDAKGQNMQPIGGILRYTPSEHHEAIDAARDAVEAVKVLTAKVEELAKRLPV